MKLAATLLRLAQWITPPERNDWLKAMQAEYLALATGGLRWAVGCVAVAIGWRLTKDGLYAAMVAAAIWFLWAAPLVTLELSIPKGFMNVGLYPDPFYMAAISMMLAIYRPRLVAVSALAIVVLYDALGTWDMYGRWLSPEAKEMGITDPSFWTFLQKYNLNDAKFVVGLFSHLGACLGGGLLGRWIAGRIGSGSGSEGRKGRAP